jgi:hypothetical protein
MLLANSTPTYAGGDWSRPMACPHNPEIAAGPVLEAVKVARGDFARGREASYTVIEPQAACRNKRLEARRRTHLQCGMVLDLNDRFLIDCQIYDRSSRGARLRLTVNPKLPRRVRLFDDLAKQMLDAEIAWRCGQNVSVRFFSLADVPCLSEAQITALRRKFYLGSRKSGCGTRPDASAP